MMDLSSLLGGQQPAGTGTVLAPQQPGPMGGGYVQPGLEQYMNPVQQSQGPIAALAQGFMNGLNGFNNPSLSAGGLGNIFGNILGQRSGFTHTGPQAPNATASHQIGLKMIASML